MFASLYSLMTAMFVLILLGFFLRRKGIIPDTGKKFLSDLVLDVVMPATIIKSFLMEIQPDFVRKMVLILAIAASIQVLALILAHLLWRWVPEREMQIYQYGTVVSNAGFLGLPVVEGVLGNTALLYSSVFLVPQRIVMWTAGISFFQSKQSSESKLAAYRKVITNPCMLATYLGIVLMIFQIQLPGPVVTTVKYLANCNTALTMIYIGSILGDGDFKGLISFKQLFYASIRLFFMPLFAYIGCMLCGIEPLLGAVATLITAMPAGSTTPILAARYGADEATGAKAVILTTVLSMATLPAWSFFLLSRLG